MMKYTLLLSIVLLTLSCGQQEGKEKDNSAELEQKKAEELRDMKLEQGRKVVQESFAVLSSQLQSAMKDSGVSHALKYCNTAAYPLTDSLSEAYDVNIKRTALNYRNPDNKPTSLEEDWMNNYQEMLNKHDALRDTLVEVDGKFHYFNPIILMENCKKCHGKPGVNIAEEDFELINELYPKDRAINFSTGDLRGMWVVTWNN